MAQDARIGYSPTARAILQSEQTPAERRLLAYQTARFGFAPSYYKFVPPPEGLSLRVANPDEIQLCDLFDPVTCTTLPVMSENDIGTAVRRALISRNELNNSADTSRNFDPSAPLDMFDPTDRYVTAVKVHQERKERKGRTIESLTQDGMYLIDPSSLRVIAEVSIR